MPCKIIRFNHQLAFCQGFKSIKLKIKIYPRFPELRSRRVAYIWGSSPLLNYYTIIDDDTEKQFFDKFENKMVIIAEEEKYDENDGSQGSEIVRSDESIKIPSNKKSLVGRLYKQHRINISKRVKKIVFGETFCAILCETGKVR